MQEIKLKDIREATYDANLDTEYREALAHSLMGLGYVSDSPLNLSMGTPKEKEELKRGIKEIRRKIRGWDCEKRMVAIPSPYLF